MRVRFHKDNWTNYNGDYSYIPGQFVFVDSTKATMYCNGQLTCGTEP